MFTMEEIKQYAFRSEKKEDEKKDKKVTKKLFPENRIKRLLGKKFKSNSLESDQKSHELG